MLRAARALLGFVWKLAAAVVVTLLVLLAVGWVVDAVVAPADQEITTVDR